jgi:hypothetical protein
LSPEDKFITFAVDVADSAMSQQDQYDRLFWAGTNHPGANEIICAAFQNDSTPFSLEEYNLMFNGWKGFFFKMDPSEIQNPDRRAEFFKAIEDKAVSVASQHGFIVESVGDATEEPGNMYYMLLETALMLRFPDIYLSSDAK